MSIQHKCRRARLQEYREHISAKTDSTLIDEIRRWSQFRRPIAELPNQEWRDFVRLQRQEAYERGLKVP